MSGPQLYDADCSTCHQARAQGSFDGGLPPLFHNTALGRFTTNNLVMVMLDGIHRETDPPDLPMPGFAKLSDRQLATLGSYLTQRYGNPQATVTMAQVTTLRAGGAASHLVLIARLAIATGIIAPAVLGVLRSAPQKLRSRHDALPPIDRALRPGMAAAACGGGIGRGAEIDPRTPQNPFLTDRCGRDLCHSSAAPLFHSHGGGPSPIRETARKSCRCWKV